MVELEVRGDVHVLHMDEGENRFNPPFLTRRSRGARM